MWAGHSRAAGTSVTSQKTLLWASLLPSTQQGVVLVSDEAPKYHRVNSCNVHYQCSVHPAEGTRLAQIWWRS